MNALDIIISVLIVVTVIVCAIKIHLHHVARREAIERSRNLYPSSVKNVQFAFCVDPDIVGMPMSPTSGEDSIIHDVHLAVPYAWTAELSDRVWQSMITVWPVRSSDQFVNYNALLLVPWNTIPAMCGIPESRPGQGYGGMRFGRDIYVATYHDGRDPLLLYIHELTHLASGIAEHNSEFARWESALASVVM